MHTEQQPKKKGLGGGNVGWATEWITSPFLIPNVYPVQSQSWHSTDGKKTVLIKTGLRTIELIRKSAALLTAENLLTNPVGDPALVSYRQDSSQ